MFARAVTLRRQNECDGEHGWRILERRVPRSSWTNHKAERQRRQTRCLHRVAAHLEGGPHGTAWQLSVECALHPVKLTSAGNDVRVVILKGKVKKIVQQSHMCWDHHSRPFGEPSGFQGGVDTFRFYVALFGQTAPQLDREWHLARASWPLRHGSCTPACGMIAWSDGIAGGAGQSQL